MTINIERGHAFDAIEKSNEALAEIGRRLHICADQSEQGRNFADTPQACREAAVAISEMIRLRDVLTPFIEAINALERDYGFDRPDWQGQTTVLPLSDLKAIRQAVLNE